MPERQEHDFTGTDLRNVIVRGAEVRGGGFTDCRLLGLDIWNVEIHADLQNVVINGVDIGPLVEAELNRRDPERAKMRPETPDGFREAWAILERRWSETVERARTFDEATLHEHVGDEWSFVQTLRHLCFASDAWVGRMVLGNPSPWHPLDLPWDEAPGWDGIPWDREARPRSTRCSPYAGSARPWSRTVIEGADDEQLASTVTMTEPGWPQLEDFPLKECLFIVLNEEWEHRQYAERDLTALEARPA